ncbi:MAG: hypothetical protein JNK82_16775, partial [Myxococcaceae bacterium]|nr:hypothetical protein [Myxococcaceae bacterium]
MYRKLLLAVLLCSLRAFADYAPGAFVTAYHTSCTPFSPQTEVLVMAQAGVFHPPNDVHNIGEVYYVGVTVGTVGMNCSGYTGATLEVFLPPNTRPAISAANPVTCGRSDNGTFVNVPAADCPQALTAGYQGGLMLPKVYTIPYATTYYVSVPVVSTKPLNGIASTNHKVRWGVNSISADAAWLFPEALVIVADRLPSFNTLPAATTLVTKRGFRAAAEVLTWFRTGKVFFDWGTSASYGSSSSFLEIPEGEGFSAWTEFTDLVPGTTYHWRARFVADDGKVAYSADHVVTTLPPSRFVLNVVSETGGSVTRTPDAADYVEESVVTVSATALEGYRFTRWKLDGAAVGTSAQMTVTMDRAHDVVASFEVVPPAEMPSMPPPPTMMQPPPSMNPQQPPPAQPAPPPSM